MTLLGSLIWCYALVYVGVKFGQHIDAFKSLWHKFDVGIIIACVILVIWYVYHHFKNLKDS